jgi:hypothetical protein
MKNWVLALVASGAVAAIPACSSDSDSGGGSGGTGTGGGGTGGIVTGGTGGGITGGSGGGTGAVGGGNTGGSGNTGTGGGSSNCGNQLLGQQCNVLQAQDPAQNACLQGECCDEVNACLADAECAALLQCGSECLQGGGNPQSCSQTCSACATQQNTITIYNAINTCITSCTGNPSDGGNPSDAAASD